MKRLLLIVLLASPGCAYMRGTWLNPNCHFGTDVELPCYCHASAAYRFQGGCPPPAPVVSGPRTCYRMTMGCDDIQWDDKPDARGVLHGKCSHREDDTPHEIPCDSVPSSSGSR